MSKRKRSKRGKSSKSSNKKNYSKYYFYALIILIIGIFTISVITTTNFDNKDALKEQGFKPVDTNYENKENTKIQGHDLNKDNKLDTAYNIDVDSTLEDFKGKPSVILFAGTYCGHCTSLVPKFEKEIWNNYNKQVNLWVQVINQDRFDVDSLKQGYNANLNYNDITKSKCGYIPSFVVLNKEGEVVLESCGSKKDIEDIKKELDSRL